MSESSEPVRCPGCAQEMQRLPFNRIPEFFSSADAWECVKCAYKVTCSRLLAAGETYPLNTTKFRIPTDCKTIKTAGFPSSGVEVINVIGLPGEQLKYYVTGEEGGLTRAEFDAWCKEKGIS